jgi:predicted nucleic acid-binding protein
MSWRRFLVLIGGLSARSRLMLATAKSGGPARLATAEEGLDAFHRIGR